MLLSIKINYLIADLIAYLIADWNYLQNFRIIIIYKTCLLPRQLHIKVSLFKTDEK